MPSRNMIALVQAITLSIIMFIEKCGTSYDPFTQLENVIGSICTFGGDGIQSTDSKTKKE